MKTFILATISIIVLTSAVVGFVYLCVSLPEGIGIPLFISPWLIYALWELYKECRNYERIKK